MERLRIKKGVKGPAWIMVPLSESLPDRLLFNEVVSRLYGRDVETEEELETAYDIVMDLEEKILSDPEFSETLVSEEELHQFHQRVIERYWGCYEGQVKEQSEAVQEGSEPCQE